MCGIVGAVDLAGKRLFDATLLEAMSAALTHRGPDEDGVHIEPGLAMATRRLAIVDIAGGSQPVTNESGSVWASFNGELFDYDAKRSFLIARGHTLQSHCDTETLPHLYEEHGLEVFERLRGQFATAIWDRDKRRLLLGRDRYGICPLYYCEADGWLIWASEVRALLRSGLIQPRASLAAIQYLFTIGNSPPSISFFEGVRSLRPGQQLVVEDSRIRTHQYWDIDFPRMGEELRAEHSSSLSKQLVELLESAVESRLKADVPVASYLSGGVDSSLVTAFASRVGPPPATFTVELTDSGFDESGLAAATAQSLGAKHTIVPMSAGRMAHGFPEFTLASECPLPDMTGVALMELARSVHSHGFKVALTGEGSDEAFAGYSIYKAHDDTATDKRQRYDSARSSAGNEASFQHIPSEIHELGFVQLESYERQASAAGRLFRPDVAASFRVETPFEELALPAERMATWHPLNRALYDGYKTVLPGRLLSSRGDRVAMHSSVETRYPFLDDELTDFAARLAPEYKLRRGRSKWLVRKLSEDYLPAMVAERPKRPFQSDSAASVLGPGRPPWVDELLSEASIARTGIFDYESVRAEHALTKVGATSMADWMSVHTVTTVIAVQLWHHIFCGGGLCALPPVS